MKEPNEVEIPKDFVTFAQNLFFDGDDDRDMTLEELMVKTLGCVPIEGGKVSVLEAFLTRLLDGGASDTTLDEIWFRSEPTYPMKFGYHRAFFEQVRGLARGWVQRADERRD